MIEHPIYVELFRITFAASIAGPMTWPLAIKLISKQQGIHNYNFLSIIKKNGIRVAYSGCLPYSAYKLFGIGTQRGVQAPVLTYLETNNSNIPSFIRYTIAGTLSGIIGGFIVTPIEQMKISLANRHFTTIPSASKFYLKNQTGLQALMCGTRITIYRNIIYDTINCILYNTSLYNIYYTIDKHSFIHMSLVNSIAGVLTAVIDYPLDVLKTRIQSINHAQTQSTISTISSSSISSISSSISTISSSSSGSPTPIPTAPRTPLKLALHMVKYEGVRSLYYGLREKLGLYFYVWFVFGIRVLRTSNG